MSKVKKKCKYGFYTCSFIGQDSFCNQCEDGDNYQERQEKRGGKREGSGRLKGEPTKTLSYRVPIKKSNKIDAQIRKMLGI